jgi:Cu-Zn family superoxide dismutase
MNNKAFRTHAHGGGRRMPAIIAVVGALSAATTMACGARDANAAVELAAVSATVGTYTLPTNESGVYPEGVAVVGDEYYVTTVGTGKVYRGDLADPQAEEFIGDAGGAHGIKVVGDHLIVAEDGRGVELFDRATGVSVASWSVREGSDANDIAIAPNGDAYVTDSGRPLLYRIPAGELRDPPTTKKDLPVFLDWTGTPFPYTEAYINANGIVATPDGKYALVVQYTDGTLFRVRLSDKKVTQVDLGGYRLITGDGMVLSGKSDLYVVRPFGSLVAKLRLSTGYDRARLVSETTNRDFHGPTTAAIAGDRLLIVNSQFSGPPSSPPWTVTSIALP